MNYGESAVKPSLTVFHRLSPLLTVVSPSHRRLTVSPSLFVWKCGESAVKSSFHRLTVASPSFTVVLLSLTVSDLPLKYEDIYRIYSNNSPSSNNSPPRIMPHFWRFWKNNTPSSNNSPPRIMPHPKRYGGKQNYKNARKIRVKLPKTRSQKSRPNLVNKL